MTAPKQASLCVFQIEHAFRELKSGLEIRPVFLRTEDHVRGHILVCFLALALEAALQRLLKEMREKEALVCPSEMNRHDCTYGTCIPSHSYIYRL